MPDYRIVELNSFAALQEILQREGIGAEERDNDFFYACDWFSNLAAHGQTHGSQLILLLAWEAGTGSAVCMPLKQDGKGLSSLSNYYSSLYGPMAWTDSGSYSLVTSAWRSLANHLRQRKPRSPQIALSPMDTAAPFYKGLVEELLAARYVVDDFFCFGNWYLQVANRSFEEYAQTLPAALRNSIGRGQKRLTRQGEWDIHIQRQAGEDLQAALEAFVQVYQRSWKQPEPHPHFIPQLVRMAAGFGWLRLGILTLQGQAIAAQLWLVKDGKASIFKLAYAEGFERFSAGSVLTHALMHHVIDTDRVREVDYLTGDDAYKRDWMSHRRERRGIIAFDLRTVAGLWEALRHFAGKRLKLLNK